MHAEAKALASTANNDINVIPVSTVKIVEDEVWLFDYFFNKTRAYIKKNSKVSLAFWSGLKGFQMKANATYLLQGEKFEKAKKWISKIHPNRTLVGLVILTPTYIFDISIHKKSL